MRSLMAWVVLVLALVLPVVHGAEPPPKVPILIDTDLGDDIDDAFAIALALASPEVDVRGLTTVAGDAYTRALILCRWLHAVGRADIPVASGRPARATPDHAGLMQYGLRPAFRKRPEKQTAVDLLYSQLRAHPGQLTLVALGPLTNVAALLTQHPESKAWIGRIVVMGGAIRTGYEGKPTPEPEWNVRSDVQAAQAVFASGVPLVVAPLDATAELKLDARATRRILDTRSASTNQLAALLDLWDRKDPVLFDPLALTLAFTERFCTMESLALRVDDRGMTHVVPGKANARVAVRTDRAAFLAWVADRLSAHPKPGAQALGANPATPVDTGRFPHLVHVVEDYETDIERRWWLAGKLETKDLPPGSRRACRGMLTNDFDDRMGDPTAMYRAVIFNPVPGPPMGKQTRLRFRCRLDGTDRLRVQIYSLTNGYHRHLLLTGLPTGRWQELTVDLTQARRPDGSGGPLAENERIDDIQFYTDASAEMLIDDIVLYDAAPPDEPRPFPKGFVFTGWFDTGRQGKEWPGDFELAAKASPHSWRAAKAVLDRASGTPWIHLHLRGERPLPATARLRFRYHLVGANAIGLEFTAPKSQATARADTLRTGAWAECVLDVPPLRSVEAVRFRVPAGAELQIDDVLLYEP